MTWARSNILGGLPVMVNIAGGGDWVEIISIHWRKKGNRPGKEIPIHVFDRARAYDHLDSCIEEACEWLAQQQRDIRE